MRRKLWSFVCKRFFSTTGSLSFTVGLPGISSNRASSGSIFQFGYRIPQVGNGINNDVEGSQLHWDPRVRKHTHHGHRCREAVYKSPRGEIQHRQWRGQSRSSQNGEVVTGQVLLQVISPDLLQHRLPFRSWNPKFCHWQSTRSGRNRIRVMQRYFPGKVCQVPVEQQKVVWFLVLLWLNS